MKKTISILFVWSVLLTGFQAVISTHYCGGMVADVKVSLSGELASCGMEGNEESCPLSESHLTNHCCENHINIAGVVNIFTIADPVPDYNLRYKSHSILSPEPGHSQITVFSAPSYSNYHPPGGFKTSRVFLENICVYRI